MAKRDKNAAGNEQSESLFANIKGALTSALTGPLSRIHKNDASADHEHQQSFTPLDPTQSFLPNNSEDDNEHDSVSSGPLIGQLKDSADNILTFQKAMKGHAAQLNKEIENRRTGAIALMTNITRLLIAGVWLFSAYAIDRAMLAGTSTPFGTMPADHASVIFDLFWKLGVIGVVGAILGVAITAMRGNSDNAKLLNTARDFGDSAASYARDFDHKLTDVRMAMEKYGDDYIKAVSALSSGFLTSVETATFFRTLNVSGERGDARQQFDAYLRNSSKAASDSDSTKYVALFGGAFAGLYMGLIAGYLTFSPPSEAAPTDIQTLLLLYPNAVSALLLPAFLYGFIGMIFDFLRGALTAGVRKQAVSEALDAVLAPFTGSDAPNLNTIAQRMVDARDIYIGNVRGQFGRKASAAPDDDAPRLSRQSPVDEGESTWRNPDSSMQFVETGFQAAPRRWRADFFSESEQGKTGAKRDASNGKNRKRD